MITAFQKIKPLPLWAKCLAVSLAVHSIGIYLMIEHPLVIKKSWATLFSPTKPLPKYISVDEDWNPDSLILQHFFEEFPAPPKKVLAPAGLSASASPFPVPEIGEEITAQMPPSFFLREKQQVRSAAPKPSSSFTLAEEEKISLVHPSSLLPPISKAIYVEATLHDISLGQKKTSHSVQMNFIPTSFPVLPSKEPITANPLNVSDAAVLQDETKDRLVDLGLPFSKRDSLASPLEMGPLPHFLQDTPFQILAGSSLAEINDYLPEQLISAIEWNDDFEVKASLFPEEEGYVFSLAVTPKQDFAQHKLKQNFYFLIDVSSDIEKHKLAVFKRSVTKALASLPSGDSFNIFLVGKKTVKLSPTNLFASPQNTLLAEEFLEKKGEDRALFSSLNLQQSLSDLLEHIDTEDEVHTAVLLTNGKSSLEPKDLRRFAQKNHGRVNLFTAAVGQNNQLAFLDMISSFSGGSLFYSDTNASFPRKLALFIKSLAEPLAKNLTLSLHATHPKANLEFSESEQLPNLYNREPFVIMGKIDRLCDLHLVLQGKSAEDQIFLKKVIHFEEATPPENSVKKAWLLHQKMDLYEKFLKDAKPIYLSNAKDILKAIHGRAFGE